MLTFKNPITMVGQINRCLLFVYRTPVADAVSLLPPQLKPVQHNGYAFWNIVVCKVQNMRPKLFPLAVGVTYWHVAYRLYVKFQTESGEIIEGLYFLRSDCDNALMSLAGNVLTDFNFHVASVSLSDYETTTNLRIHAEGGIASAVIRKDGQATLSSASPFGSLSEAQQFLKYKPSGISIMPNGSANVVRISRNEDAWKSKLVEMDQAQWSFFAGKNVEFEICYDVQPITYQWNRARVYTCASS
jgi:hypothetical protein